MKRSKKVFIIIATLFFLAMLYIGYDISSRTTFPGSKAQLKERLLKKDTLTNAQATDSISIEL